MIVSERQLAGLASRSVRQGLGILLLAFVLSFIVNMLRLTGPLFMILIYDRVLPARSEETLVSLFAMLGVFLLAQGMLDYARRRTLARFGAQFQERMETTLFAEARRGELFEAGRSKPVVGLEEVDGLRSFFHSTSLIAIYDFFWTPMFLVVVFVLDPLLGWVCLGGMTLILVLMIIRMVFVGQREAESNAASGNIHDLRTLLATSRSTLRTQDMGRGFGERWLGARRQSRDKAIAFKDWTVWFDSACDIAVLLTRYSVLATGAWLTLQGALTIGAMVAATFLVSRVLVPVEKFLTELPRIFEARRNWVQLRRILNAKSAEQTEVLVEEAGNPRSRLSLVNVSVRSPLTGEPLLRGITFDIAPGEMVQIAGITCSGKTVLAETVLGMWRKSGGTILLNGRNLSYQADADITGLLGYVPESPMFVAGTIAENISRLDPDADPLRIVGAARKACLHAIISALPDGYQTVIDAAGSVLSRGQRSQLALARAVYWTPALLIIDEPDQMLFEQMPKTMEKTFQQMLAKGGSILILARRPLALPQLSTTYQIEAGRIRLRNLAPVAQPKVAVLGDKTKPAAKDGSVTKLVRG